MEERGIQIPYPSQIAIMAIKNGILKLKSIYKMMLTDRETSLLWQIYFSRKHGEVVQVLFSMKIANKDLGYFYSF